MRNRVGIAPPVHAAIGDLGRAAGHHLIAGRAVELLAGDVDHLAGVRPGRAGCRLRGRCRGLRLRSRGLGIPGFHVQRRVAVGVVVGADPDIHAAIEVLAAVDFQARIEVAVRVVVEHPGCVSGIDQQNRVTLADHIGHEVIGVHARQVEGEVGGAGDPARPVHARQAAVANVVLATGHHAEALRRVELVTGIGVAGAGLTERRTGRRRSRHGDKAESGRCKISHGFSSKEIGFAIMKGMRPRAPIGHDPCQSARPRPGLRGPRAASARKAGPAVLVSCARVPGHAKRPLRKRAPARATTGGVGIREGELSCCQARRTVAAGAAPTRIRIVDKTDRISNPSLLLAYRGRGIVPPGLSEFGASLWRADPGYACDGANVRLPVGAANNANGSIKSTQETG